MQLGNAKAVCRRQYAIQKPLLIRSISGMWVSQFNCPQVDLTSLAYLNSPPFGYYAQLLSTVVHVVFMLSSVNLSTASLPLQLPTPFCLNTSSRKIEPTTVPHARGDSYCKIDNLDSRNAVSKMKVTDRSTS